MCSINFDKNRAVYSCRHLADLSRVAEGGKPMKYYDLDNQIETIFVLFEQATVIWRDALSRFDWSKADSASADKQYIVSCLGEIWDDAIEHCKWDVCERCERISKTILNTQHKTR